MKIEETYKINGFKFTGNYIADTNSFLNFCTADIKMQYLGKDYPLFDEKKLHDLYYVTIHTTRGKMSFKFYDSTLGTEKNDKRTRFNQKRRVYSTNYDIIICLEKEDSGSLEDFILKFGYEIRKEGDLFKIISIYNGCCEEYRNLCKCFALEQIEIMKELCNM